jgi:hypothetical protein
MDMKAETNKRHDAVHLVGYIAGKIMQKTHPQHNKVTPFTSVPTFYAIETHQTPSRQGH